MAKVLHARYARTRLETLKNESSRLAGEGRPAGADKARENRALGEAVASLEAALEDPKAAKKAQGLKEAAEESRSGITTVWWTCFRYATATSFIRRSS